MRRTQWTPVRLAHFRKLLRTYTVTDAAPLLGVSRTAASSAAARYGLIVPQRQLKQRVKPGHPWRKPWPADRGAA